MYIPFTGCATALVTPMRDGAVDFAALSRLIEFQISAGVSALIPCGTTGEAPTLHSDEKRRIIAHTVKAAAGRVPVIAGCGSPSTDFAAQFAHDAASDGADAILCVTPYYNKATDEGLYLHYGAVADACGLPIIVYNVPHRTGLRLGEPALEKLCKIPNVCAVKEASGDIAYAARLIQRFGSRLAFYCGCDELCAPFYACGGAGLISVVSNIVPGAAQKLCRTCESGKLCGAVRLQKELFPLISALFSELSPIPVKRALKYMQMCSDEVRLPLCKMTAAGAERLLSVMTDMGLIPDSMRKE